MDKKIFYESPWADLKEFALPQVLCQSGGGAGYFDEETFTVIS